jgi:hypothetical protein
MSAPHTSKVRPGSLPVVAAALACLCTPPVFVQTRGEIDEGEVQVIGSVAPVCMLGEPSETVIDLGTLVDTSGPRIGRMAALAPRQITMPGSFCNYANTMVSIVANAMTEQSGAALNSGFSRTVNYRIVVRPWATLEADLLTAAAADGSGPQGQAFSASQPLPQVADLTMELSSFAAPSDALLVAGEYSGLITVTLGPVTEM